MNGEAPRPVEPLTLRCGVIVESRTPILTGAALGVLALIGLAVVLPAASANGRIEIAVADETQARRPEGSLPEVVVHVSDLSRSALHEFEFWNDRASPGGRMVGIPDTGDELDPPPEDDPHVLLRIQVQRGVPYRCWIHMKVGPAKGVAQANLLYVQFTGAVDKGNNEVFGPGTGSYLTARGPARAGWAWVGCDAAGPGSPGSLIYFRTTGAATARVQAGMEGVGFDQFVLSPARFLDRPPSEPVVAKPER